MTKKKTFFCGGVHIVSDIQHFSYNIQLKQNHEFLVMTKFQQSTPVIAILGTLSQHLIQ